MHRNGEIKIPSPRVESKPGLFLILFSLFVFCHLMLVFFLSYDYELLSA